ncbi:hypothetical protein [Spiroplasma ixodetis]|uniref:hypothetical protein n=1 Tax=Spiroplasma ixodetis TaxID=2141 RepID=UPI002574D418|nr:hypothetical protein [Spiroplasma ixodetis]
MTDTLKKIGKIYYEDTEAFSGLGLFILRFTLLPFWNKLEPVTKKLRLFSLYVLFLNFIT